jgi:hypothetical protein
MDFKYKHFHQERLFPYSHEAVLEATRAVIAESMGWQVTTTAEGFMAEGSSFGHNGIAHFRIEPSGSETKVSVDLSVERTGFTGFMLFDVGGYYNIQIRKWLNAIQSSTHQNSTGQQTAVAPALVPPNKTAARMFHGLLLLIAAAFGLYIVVIFISALVGLLTGNLFLLGRGHNTTLHGPLARVMSAVILLFGIWIVWRIKKKPARSVLP